MHLNAPCGNPKLHQAVTVICSREEAIDTSLRTATMPRAIC
jgi:hypothetical protein